jgi:hypothetical protein
MISGSGGMGGGRQKTQSQTVIASQPAQYVPTEQTNNLFSTSYARILDLIGEGEIDGLVNGWQGIYLDNTPVQNPNGSVNFSGVTVETRTGTQAQTYIPGFDEIASEIGVGVVVTLASPVIRTISTACDATRVVVTLPALQEYTDKGDILGATARVLIAIQYNGGGYTDIVDDTIAGRTSQQYQRQYLINLSGPFPVDIRVGRGMIDSTSSKLANAFSFSSYSAITYAKLAYPNSALVGLRIDAEQFNSIPSRSYRVRGLKVKIPSNATVDYTTGRLLFSGVWDGSFGAAQWCSDPAWCLWDLLTSTRYGFGDHLDTSKLDKWAFYSASQYSSALIPDGFGGYEPRFSCNINIQTGDDAYKIINDLCSTMRVMPYWAAGALTISQDRPADPSFLFTLANVGPEGFTYSGSSVKARPTVAVIRYTSLALRDVAFETVEDAEGIARYGVVKVEVDAIGCTSRGQAARLGKWILYTEKYGETVSFTSNLASAVAVRPGQIIEVADPLRSGARRGGAIAAATTTAITLDDATGLTTANSPTLSVILTDGTAQARAVASISGNVVTVSPAFSSAPQANSIWIYETSNIQASTWRVLAVEERDGIGCAVTALAHNPSKFGFIEQGLALERQDITDLDILPAAPQNLTGVEVLYEAGSRALAKLQLSWSMTPGVSTYRVSYRETNGNWLTRTASANDFEILDTRATTYEVLVSSMGVGLLASPPASLSVTTYGKTAAPSSPTGLSLIAIDQASAILSWDLAPDLDVRLGGKVLIRHSVLTSGATWENSTDLVASAAGSQTQKQVPLLTGTVLVKFEDDSGNRSASAASVVVTLPTPQPRLLVQTYAEEAEPFQGVFTNTAYSVELGGLVLIPELPLFDSLATDNNFDGISGGSIDAIGSAASSGEYDFGSSYDLGRIFDVNLIRRLVTTPYLPASLFDDRIGDIDDWPFFDEAADRVTASTWVRTTNDDPTGSPTWGPWREFANAIVRGRALQFKAVAETQDPSQSIIISELGANLELQQRVESSATLTSTAAPFAVTFDAPFYQPPSVGITAYGLASTEQFTVASVTATGFTVTFSGTSGNLARSFTYTAVGFGRAI